MGANLRLAEGLDENIRGRRSAYHYDAGLGGIAGQVGPRALGLGADGIRTHALKCIGGKSEAACLVCSG